jgi:hypothetical protein
MNIRRDLEPHILMISFYKGTDHESIILNNIIPFRKDGGRPLCTYDMIVNSNNQHFTLMTLDIS